MTERQNNTDILSEESQMAFAWSRFESMRDLGLLPGKVVIAGLRHAAQVLDREHHDPEAMLNQKYDAFEEFLASEEGTYQADFDTHTKQGSTVFQAFTEKVKENHQIEIVEPDDSGLAEIPMLNGHRLEIHRQKSGGYFLIGSHRDN